MAWAFRLSSVAFASSSITRADFRDCGDSRRLPGCDLASRKLRRLMAARRRPPPSRPSSASKVGLAARLRPDRLATVQLLPDRDTRAYFSPGRLQSGQSLKAHCANSARPGQAHTLVPALLI